MTLGQSLEMVAHIKLKITTTTICQGFSDYLKVLASCVLFYLCLFFFCCLCSENYVSL